MPVTERKKRKRLVIYAFIFPMLAAGLFLGVQINRYNAKIRLKQGYARTFPILDLISLTRKSYNTRQLSGAPVNKLVVVFDPDCDHCTYEIHELLSNAGKFKNTSILFISPQPVQLLEKFENELDRISLPNVMMFSIDQGQLFKTFNIKSFPEIYLYGKDNKEIINYTGEIPSTVILSEINK